MKSYSLSDVALYVITAVMEGNCYELLLGSGNVENNSLFQKVSISESLYFYLNFLSVHRSTHSYWCQWRIIYSESERDTWIKSGTGEFVTIGRPQKMFNDLNYSFKYFCVIYSRSFIYLSRSNPCSRLCAMFITYTWKCTTFLFDFVLFLLDSFMQGDVFGFMW